MPTKFKEFSECTEDIEVEWTLCKFAALTTATSACRQKWLEIVRKEPHGGTKGLMKLFGQRRRPTKPDSITSVHLLCELGTLGREKLHHMQ